MTRIVVVFGACALAALIASAQVKLPEGEGKDLVVKVCTACHSYDAIVAGTRTEAEWKATVEEMASRGAEATEEEFKLIVKYLTKNFGKP